MKWRPREKRQGCVQKPARTLVTSNHINAAVRPEPGAAQSIDHLLASVKPWRRPGGSRALKPVSTWRRLGPLNCCDVRFTVTPESFSTFLFHPTSHQVNRKMLMEKFRTLGRTLLKARRICDRSELPELKMLYELLDTTDRYRKRPCTKPRRRRRGWTKELTLKANEADQRRFIQHV